MGYRLVKSTLLNKSYYKKLFSNWEIYSTDFIIFFNAKAFMTFKEGTISKQFETGNY